MTRCKKSARKNHDPVPEEPPGDILADLAEMRHGLAASLESMNALLRQMAATQQDIAGHLQRMQASLDEVTALAPLVRRHETDIVQRLAHQTAERQDIGSERYRDQQGVWKRFDEITRRPVAQIVNDILRRDDRLNDRVAKAKLVRRVVRLLFGPDGDPDATPGTSARNVSTPCSAMRTRSGRPPRKSAWSRTGGRWTSTRTGSRTGHRRDRLGPRPSSYPPGSRTAGGSDRGRCSGA